MEKLTVFDPAGHLGTEEDIACYLEAAVNDEDPKAFQCALRTAAKAKGMASHAAKALMLPPRLGAARLRHFSPVPCGRHLPPERSLTAPGALQKQITVILLAALT